VIDAVLFPTVFKSVLIPERVEEVGHLYRIRVDSKLNYFTVLSLVHTRDASIDKNVGRSSHDLFRKS
jgi:hypothetical protein